ncbi:MAG: hypothetical protein RLZZ182_1851 [Pseudomonadota bacterium]|jgi:ParB family chromosome partitioning protein
MAKTSAKKKPAATPAPTGEIYSVPLSCLARSPLNARRTPADPEGIATLAENIAALGMLHNLVVIESEPGAMTEVIDGGRRLAALQLLADAGRIASDHPVPCKRMGVEQAVALSLAANDQREAMHPIDEAEAFTTLVKRQKMKAADVAVLYGVTKRYVAQRLSLGALPDEIRAACSRGEITLAACEAFTTTTDREKQLDIFRKGDAKSLTDWNIRRLLREDTIDAEQGVVKLIGLDAYKAAGGRFVTDLFSGDDESTLLSDAELVYQLVEKKLAPLAKKVKGEGWKWVHVNLRPSEYRPMRSADETKRAPTPEEVAEESALRAEALAINEKETTTDEEESRLDAIGARLDEIEEAQWGYTREQSSMLGARIRVSHMGEPVVLRGFVADEDADTYAKWLAARKPTPAGEQDDEQEPPYDASGEDTNVDDDRPEAEDVAWALHDTAELLVEYNAEHAVWAEKLRALALVIFPEFDPEA